MHDAEAVLAAADAGASGVALIAGTGSFAFGRGEGDRVVRAGGWGYLLGDEGSGFAMGQEALLRCLPSGRWSGPGNVPE